MESTPVTRAELNGGKAAGGKRKGGGGRQKEAKKRKNQKGGRGIEGRERNDKEFQRIL